MGFQRGTDFAVKAKRLVMRRKRGRGRVDVRAAGHVLLEDVVLDGALQRRQRHALLLGHRRVEAQQDGRGGVDGHRGADLAQRQPVEQHVHVAHRADRHPDLAHLAERAGAVGVEAHLRGQVEGHGEAGLPALEQRVVAGVAVLGAAEAGVLAHRPEAAAVHGGLHAAGEGVLAGKPEGVRVVSVGGPIERGALDAAGGLEAGLPFRALGLGLLVDGACPLLPPGREIAHGPSSLAPNGGFCRYCRA